jgi:endonuclease/exonuclease/phosphatase family metal-dependent hydrolase
MKSPKFASSVLVILILMISVSGSAATAFQKSGEKPDPSRMRVMTFNIRYNNPGDQENAWPNRKKMAASMFRFHHVDLVGVQEALQGQIDDLAALLPEYGWVGVGRDDGKSRGEFSAIFYRKDRYTALENSTFWLSETPETVGSKGWDGFAIARVR